MHLHDGVNFGGMKRFMGKNKSLWYAVVAFTLVFNMCLVGLIVYDKSANKPKKYKASDLLGYSEVSEELLGYAGDDELYLGNYKIMKNDATGVAYAYFEGSESEVLVKLLNADGTEKIYSSTDKNVLTVVGKGGDSLVLEDRDTGVAYLVQEDFKSYKVM